MTGGFFATPKRPHGIGWLELTLGLTIVGYFIRVHVAPFMWARAWFKPQGAGLGSTRSLDIALGPFQLSV